MSYVPIEQILASVDSIYAYGDVSAWARWKNWAYQAEAAIGPVRGNIRNATLPIVDGTVEKPCDYLWCEEFALANLPDTPTDTAGDPGNNTFLSNVPLQNCQLVYPLYRGDTFYAICHTSSRNKRRTDYPGAVNYGGITYSESAERFYLDNLGQTGINACVLAYMAQPLDDNGDLLVPHDHERAVIAYIEWHEEKRRSKQYPNLVGAGQLANAERLWGTLKMNARGRDNMPDAAQLREIAKRSMSMIQRSSLSRAYDYRSNGRI